MLARSPCILVSDRLLLRPRPTLWQPDHIDALVTVAGGAAMLGWLLFGLSCTPS